MPFLKERTTTEQTDVLAGYLPNDILHRAKNKDGANLRKILIGLAAQWLNFRSTLNDVFAEYNPNNTTALIEEWEEFVGIPDSCISNTGTLAQRRTNILLKLAGINATTSKQFETIAATLGYTVQVQSGVDTSTFPMTFPIILMSAAEAPFVIVVTMSIADRPSGFTYTFPLTFTSQAPVILECLFNKLKPANTLLFFRYS